MLLLSLLVVWASADIGIKVYFYWKRNRCLYCKRLRGHDDDCGLDMASLPPPSHAVASTEKRSDYYEDMP